MKHHLVFGRSLACLAIALTGLVALSGCGGRLTLTRINSAEAKPNNVWVFFTVEHGDEPVGGLQASDFEIYEDGKQVSVFESQQRILNPEVAAVMYTALLIDVSGSITEAGHLDDLVDAAELFTERVGKTQKVGIYAFDGSDKIYPVVPFTETEGTLKGGLDGLRKFKPKDPSTNLHGAVVQGLEELRRGLEKEQKPLKFGTLVVFSDGADRAARVSREEMNETLQDEKYVGYDRFAIGIGDEDEIEAARLDAIGRDGTEEGSDRAKVKEAFEKIAAKIEAHSKRFYLLSYCTPSRNGTHAVEIRAETADPKASGKLEYGFDAGGFGPPPDCDPERAPTFDMEDVEPEEGKGKGGPTGKEVTAGEAGTGAKAK
ncbi:MAG: VWA domain-containing protein [Polyangiaceae bacterium]|nr:VWA domain-containing protein [Polyangiaceae bacterium]